MDFQVGKDQKLIINLVWPKFFEQHVRDALSDGELSTTQDSLHHAPPLPPALGVPPSGKAHCIGTGLEKILGVLIHAPAVSNYHG